MAVSHDHLGFHHHQHCLHPHHHPRHPPASKRRWLKYRGVASNGDQHDIACSPLRGRTDKITLLQRLQRLQKGCFEKVFTKRLKISSHIAETTVLSLNDTEINNYKFLANFWRGGGRCWRSWCPMLHLLDSELQLCFFMDLEHPMV